MDSTTKMVAFKVYWVVALTLTSVEKEGVRKTEKTEFFVVVRNYADPVEASGLT